MLKQELFFYSKYVCGPFGCSVHGRQKRALNPLELDLQMAVNHQEVLWKSSQCPNS